MDIKKEFPVKVMFKGSEYSARYTTVPFLTPENSLVVARKVSEPQPKLDVNERQSLLYFMGKECFNVISRTQVIPLLKRRGFKIEVEDDRLLITNDRLGVSLKIGLNGPQVFLDGDHRDVQIDHFEVIGSHTSPFFYEIRSPRFNLLLTPKLNMFAYSVDDVKSVGYSEIIRKSNRIRPPKAYRRSF